MVSDRGSSVCHKSTDVHQGMGVPLKSSTANPVPVIKAVIDVMLLTKIMFFKWISATIKT